MMYILILYDPKEKTISQFKYGDYDLLFFKLEFYKKLAMTVNEKVLFFKVDDLVDVDHLEYLKYHSLTNISYLKNFKHCNYII